MAMVTNGLPMSKQGQSANAMSHTMCRWAMNSLEAITGLSRSPGPLELGPIDSRSGSSSASRWRGLQHGACCGRVGGRLTHQALVCEAAC